MIVGSVGTVGGSSLADDIARLVQDSDRRMAKEDPKLLKQVQAARERQAQEVLVPTPTGYELKREN